MKIVDLKTYVVGASWRNLIFIRLDTDHDKLAQGLERLIGTSRRMTILSPQLAYFPRRQFPLAEL